MRPMECSPQTVPTVVVRNELHIWIASSTVAGVRPGRGSVGVAVRAGLRCDTRPIHADTPHLVSRWRHPNGVGWLLRWPTVPGWDEMASGFGVGSVRRPYLAAHRVRCRWHTSTATVGWSRRMRWCRVNWDWLKDVAVPVVSFWLFCIATVAAWMIMFGGM